MTVTRFAPSPTGRLHLGHAYSALLAHDFARSRGGRFLLRIEDIDPGRSRDTFVDGIEEDLAWLGLAWDGPVRRQSQHLADYAAALDRLKSMGLAYPCFCTRKDIAESAAAPHHLPLPGGERATRVSERGEGGRKRHPGARTRNHPFPNPRPSRERGPTVHGPDGLTYRGTCRHLSNPDTSRPHAWRLDIAKALSRTVPLVWLDHDKPVPADPLPFGDIVLARKDAPTSYHLAVTVDDALQGVTDVVRGEDLFAATHIHRLLQALLGLPTPAYHHHPLLNGPDGQRLAKRHGAPTLADIRERGDDPTGILASLRARDGVPTEAP